jgi:hypothetical protein
MSSSDIDLGEAYLGAAFLGAAALVVVFFSFSDFGAISIQD